MLEKFSVENFKGFKDKLTFDIGSPNNYSFNSEIIENGCVTKGIIYGINSCGKSNLGLAIFDLITHLTEKQKLLSSYDFYMALKSDWLWTASPDGFVNEIAFVWEMDNDGYMDNHDYIVNYVGAVHPIINLNQYLLMLLIMMDLFLQLHVHVNIHMHFHEFSSITPDHKLSQQI